MKSVGGTMSFVTITVVAGERRPQSDWETTSNGFTRFAASGATIEKLPSMFTGPSTTPPGPVISIVLADGATPSI